LKESDHFGNTVDLKGLG